MFVARSVVPKNTDLIAFTWLSNPVAPLIATVQSLGTVRAWHSSHVNPYRFVDACCACTRDRLSAACICANVPAPPWQYVHDCAPAHCGVRYALLPSSGFALLWHHTLLHVPDVQVIAGLKESAPDCAAFSAYDGVGLGSAGGYGFTRRFAE